MTGPAVGETAVLMVNGGDRWWSLPCPVIPERCCTEFWQFAYDHITAEARVYELDPADLTWVVEWR